MKKLLLIALAIIAVRLGGRALRRNAEVMAALWALLAVCAAQLNQANTPKARATEDRVNALVGQVGVVNGNAFQKTGGPISGSVSVAGNHTVAGNISAQGVSSTASVAGTSAHFTGSSVTDGNHQVGGQVLINGASSSAALAGNGDAHMTGIVQGDGGLNTSGTASAGAFSGGSSSVSGASSAGNFTGGSIHVSGNSQTDGTHTVGGDVNASGTVRGSMHASVMVIDTMSAVASPAATLTSLKQAVDGILNRLT